MVLRRGWMRNTWLWTAAPGLTLTDLALTAEVSGTPTQSRLGMPGLRPGRVVAVSHPACILEGRFQADPIGRMIDVGVMALTDAEDPTGAWKQFFERGDVVGIKVSPVGGPLVMSCAEVLQRIIAGLESAGVRRKDIVVYDRFRKQFLEMGVAKWLPDGVRWTFAAHDYDAV